MNSFKIDDNSKKLVVDQYSEWYNSQPLFWRIWNRLWWLTHNIYCAFTNKVPLMHEMTLRVLKKEIEKNEKLEEQLKVLHNIQKRVF